MNALLQDPWIVAQIDKAVAPYIGKLPAADVAWMREQLAETLAHDDYAGSILRAAQPRVVDESGEVARGEAAPQQATPLRPAANAKKAR